MKRLLSLFLLLITLQVATAQQIDYLRTEYVICSGGPALRKFEEYRVSNDRHDRYWGNFITAARIRMQQLRAQHGPALNITWMIYRPSYLTRQVEDRASTTVQYVCDMNTIQEVAGKVGAKIIWFSTTPEFVSFLNRHTRMKMCGFEYYGHSNKYCFLFEYGSEILGASTCYLHVNQINQLNRGIFTSNAHVQSYGCNMADGADSMYRAWKRATGHPMIAATGKTDFTAIKDGRTLPTVIRGTWAR
jgi:hypothetical protein